MTELELYFQYRCEKGLKKKGLADKSEYQKRLKYEINVITSMGYCGYFLIVSDLLTWALANKIPVGPGRGSAAGALVAYVLEITHLDPIKYGLIFERFLNPARKGASGAVDIDMDFCEDRRLEVVQYAAEKYGADKVAHIGTYGSMKAKAAIRAVANALGHPYQLGDKLAKMTLEPVAGKPVPLKTCYEKVKELNYLRYGEDSPSKEVLRWAEKIEDRIRSFGTHASGVVISADPIASKIPLYPGKDGKPTTQFDMNTVEERGLIKFDFLGLRALTTIDRCVKSISERHGTHIDPLQIPVDDPEVFKKLQTGDVTGVFQLEGSSGMRDLVVRIRPNSLEDLALLVAIYRPGPLESSMLQHYLKVRAGQATPQYIVPELEPILGSTDGMLIYQEQILEICKQLAGYDLAEADLMRRAVGKKKKKEMDAQYGKFIDGMVANNIPKKKAQETWEEIKSFASYGFNKSVDKDTLVDTIEGPRKIKDFCGNEEIISIDKEGYEVVNQVKCLHNHGKVPMWEVEFDNGTTEKCTLDHKWLTQQGQQPLWRILQEDLRILGDRTPEEWNKFDHSQGILVWPETQDPSSRGKEAQAELHSVQSHQKTNQTKDKSEIESISTHERDRIKDCKDYLSATRNTETESTSAGKMEKGKPRKASRGDNQSSENSQEIKDGGMVGTKTKTSWVQKKCPTSMWRSEEAGGLCKQKSEMGDRSGWTVAFSTGEWRRDSQKDSDQRQDARQRDKKEKMDPSKTQYGELQNLWRTYKDFIESDFTNIQYQAKRYLQDRQIVRIKYLGLRQAYDLEVYHHSHNFLLSSGLCCSNSHAACYAYIGYQMAWLKTYYPLEFMCACLISDSDEVDKVIQYISYCKAQGIPVLGPSINESQYDFSVASDGQSIRFGLSAIKNLGKPVQEIIEERESGGPFTDFLDFTNRVNLSKINKRKLESLVLAGAFDNLADHTRASLIEAIEDVLRYKDDLKRHASKKETFIKRFAVWNVRQLQLIAWEVLTKEEKKKARAEGEKKPGKLLEPTCPEIPLLPAIQPTDEMDITDILAHEKELMGFFISGHPLDNVKETLWHTILRIKEKVAEGKLKSKTRVSLIGIPNVIKEITTKKNKQKMAYVVLEDKTGTIQAVVLPKPYMKSKELIDIQTPARYDTEVEITEGDMESVIKLMVTKVSMLPSIRAYRNRPIKVTVPIDLICEASQVIHEAQGNNFNVELSTRSAEGDIWHVGTFRCRGKQTDLEKSLKEFV